MEGYYTVCFAFRTRTEKASTTKETKVHEGDQYLRGRAQMG